MRERAACFLRDWHSEGRAPQFQRHIFVYLQKNMEVSAAATVRRRGLDLVEPLGQGKGHRKDFHFS